MQMNTGQYVSGAGHLLLIGWALIGGIFSSPEDLPFEAVNVSVVTADEFIAMNEAAAPRETEEPAAEEPVPEPVAEAEPPPEPEAQPEPEPVVEEPPPEPEPVPEPEPPSTEAAPPPPLEQGSTVLENEVPDASVQEAPRVTDVETPQAETPPQDAPEQPAVAPDEEAPVEEPPVEVVEETSPEPTTTDIVTEADTPGAGEGATEPQPEIVATAAPARSPRPQPRRERPAPTPEPVAETRPEPDPAPEPDPTPEPEPERTPEPAPEQPDTSTEDAIAAAAAAAAAEAARTIASETGGTGTAAVGPPMTGGENGDFLASVRRCWSVLPNSQASRVWVTMAFTLDENRKLTGTPTRIKDSGGDPAAIRAAEEAARIALFRCSQENGGFKLPADKFAHWRQVELTFDASGGVSQ